MPPILNTPPALPRPNLKSRDRAQTKSTSDLLKKPSETTLKQQDIKLIKACQNNDVDEVYRQIWDNANPNTKIAGTSPLALACQVGSLSIASLLVQSGAVIKTCNEYSVTPLHWAAGV